MHLPISRMEINYIHKFGVFKKQLFWNWEKCFELELRLEIKNQSGIDGCKYKSKYYGFLVFPRLTIFACQVWHVNNKK